MNNFSPDQSPDQIWHRTRLSRGWHRIRINGQSIQLTGDALRVALSVAYHPADPDWLGRLSVEARGGHGHLYVGGRCVSPCFVL